MEFHYNFGLTEGKLDTEDSQPVLKNSSDTSGGIWCPLLAAAMLSCLLWNSGKDKLAEWTP